jgi:hypothetical protein
MTDEEHKQEATDEKIEDLEASEQDAEQVRGGVLSNIANTQHEAAKTLVNKL